MACNRTFAPFRGSELPQKVLGAMAEIYGPIFSIKLGVHRALVISSGEIAKDFYTTNDKVFVSRPKSMAVVLMGYNYAMFGLAPYGDYWRQVRKIIMLEVDMQQWFKNLMLNVIVRIVSGKSFSLIDEEGIRFQNVARRFFELFGAFVVSVFIPYLKCFDLGGYKKDMKITTKEIDDIFEGLLQANKREKESKQQHESNQVFVDVLISVLEGAYEEDFPGFDHSTIINASCLAILIAGLDTTSVTLTWALSLLLNNIRNSG
uniref:Cytochrome P450 n=1 Tax=Lactuca sativa TaxID=4236 RepID=A0A9R1VZV0_LACSA|nr:hypothetical protein LSAT_V11C400205200 [Lactuca sativa]